jgi:hypothetical protein
MPRRCHPERNRLAWLQPNTLFGQLPIAQLITQVDRNELDPILGPNNSQLFRHFRHIKIIPTSNSFLLQGTDPINGKSTSKPFLDIQDAPTIAAAGHARAYIRYPEPTIYQAIANLLEAKLISQLDTQEMAAQFDKRAAQSQPLNFFPRILDSILTPTAFQYLSALPRIKLDFSVSNRELRVKDVTNQNLLVLKPNEISYLILLKVISKYGYYQAYDYPLLEIIQKSLIVLAIENRNTLPYAYLKPRIKEIFPQELQEQEEVVVEFIQAETPDESLLIFASPPLNTRLYPRLKLTDERVPELLGMLYGFAYPQLKQAGKWQKAATIFRFISLYELLQDEEFSHFPLTRIPLQSLLQVEFDADTKVDLTKLAVDNELEVDFTNASEGLMPDLRVSFSSPRNSQTYLNAIAPIVTISHRNPQFYACIEAIAQQWSANEERLRFLDTVWINKLIERLKPAGNYWLSYSELQPQLERLSQSPNLAVASLVQKLYSYEISSPNPYFRYFLGIKGENLIIAPYPIFLEKNSTEQINPEITAKNSLQLNILTSRTPDYLGFCRKVLELAKKLLDLGAAPGEERVRFNIPLVVNKIETHTLTFLQRHTPFFPEVIDRLNIMLLDMCWYAPQTYSRYLAGYPTNDPLSKLQQRFWQLTPDAATVNILDPTYTTLYTKDPIIRQCLRSWRSLHYPNQRVFTILLQSLELADKQKRIQLHLNKTERTKALELMLDTLLKSVQAITQYEVQIIAQQPQSILSSHKIQEKIQALLTASETIETECHIILERLVRKE